MGAKQNEWYTWSSKCWNQRLGFGSPVKPDFSPRFLSTKFNLSLRVNSLLTDTFPSTPKRHQCGQEFSLPFLSHFHRYPSIRSAKKITASHEKIPLKYNHNDGICLLWYRKRLRLHSTVITMTTAFSDVVCLYFDPDKRMKFGMQCSFQKSRNHTRITATSWQISSLKVQKVGHPLN